MITDALDLFGDASLYADGPPHALFAQLRREAPVHRTPSPHGGHVWSLFKHADVAAVSKDPATFSSAREGIFLQRDQVAPLELVRNVILYKDPPEHNRYRAVLQPFFSTRATAALEPLVQQTVNEVLDEVAEAGACDFVADVAVPIPLRVLTRLMGVPDADVPRFYDWTAEIEAAQRSLEPNQAVDTFAAMAGYLHDAIQEQGGSPADTLVRRLREAEVDGESLDDAELMTFFALLAFAGNDTTRNTCATGMLALLEHPDALERLIREPEAIAGAVEEILRYTSVVQWFARTATCDTEVRGQPIAEGERVVLWYGSASRDEDVFADPDAFDIARASTDHKAFGGGGRHFCLGNQLARLELRVIYREVLRRMPGLARAGDVERLGSSWANALTAMPVRW
ncbi:MAG: hypothetical protein QOI80_2847 [Solirubrobacteraceae bacterium]|nr:hypothetical protein [Solirubrobacteraceae bacterium]